MKCNKCLLSLYRKKIVLGEGNLKSPIMIIGEAPGIEEDKIGKPFVGKSGKLLRTLLEELNLIEVSYITNVVKCRPPENRTPEKEELDLCREYWTEEIRYIKPFLVLLLGTTSTREVLSIDTPIHIVRGKWFEFKDIKILVTYHPSAILRNNLLKGVFAKDLKELFDKYREINPNHQANIINYY